MDLDLAIKILKSAAKDPTQLCLASVDLAFPRKTTEERNRLKEALEAASVPHWFDSEVLAALLKTTLAESQELITDLSQLSVVESFPARGSGVLNVHENSRLSLRSSLFTENQANFRLLTSNAASHFAAIDSPEYRIEWIYHQLTTVQSSDTSDLECIEHTFADSASHAHNSSLASNLQELLDAGMLSGAVKVMALCQISNARSSYRRSEETASLAALALNLAQDTSSLSAKCWSWSLAGDVAKISGHLDLGHRYYERALEASKMRCRLNPANHYWQREMAQCLCKIGDVLQSKGSLSHALKLYNQSLSINVSLADFSPSSGLSSDLAAVHSRIGDIYCYQGLLQKALTSYSKVYQILEQFAAADQFSFRSQQNLATCHIKIGDAYFHQTQFSNALVEFQNATRAMKIIAEQDDANTEWQRHLGISYTRVGDALEVTATSKEAVALYEKAHDIFLRLERLDPVNALWKRELAVLKSKIAMHTMDRDAQNAIDTLEVNLRVLTELACLDPTNADIRRDVAGTHFRLAEALRRANRVEAALDHAVRDLEISTDLANLDQSNANARYDLSASHTKVGDMQLANSNANDALNSYGLAEKITSHLLLIDSSNMHWQRNLALIFSKFGKTLSALKSYREGRKALKRSLQIFAALAKRAPGNPARIRDLSSAHSDLAEICYLMGDNVVGDGYYTASVEILQQLPKPALFTQREFPGSSINEWTKNGIGGGAFLSSLENARNNPSR